MPQSDSSSGAVPLQWHRPASVATARYEIAERALNDIAAHLDQGEGTDWHSQHLTQEIRSVVDVARAQLRMAEQMRRRRRPRWLARIVSFSSPAGPAEGTADEARVCFVVEITEGSKEVRGRRVEVQASAVEADLFGPQIASMAQAVQKGKGTR